MINPMVKTHRSLAEDEAKDGPETCEVCGQPAHYWSQAVGPLYKPLSRAIPHCQRHRSGARQACHKEATKNVHAAAPDTAAKLAELESITADLVKWFADPPECPLFDLVNRARAYHGRGQLK